MPNPVDIKKDCQCKNVVHQHGTADAYMTDRCRCVECREARTALQLWKRKQVAYGRSKSHRVDAQPAREHLIELAERGWGITVVSKNTGVSQGTINRLLNGEPFRNMPPSITITASVSEKLMSYNPVGNRAKYEGKVSELTDSIGSKRRIQALCVLGFSVAYLSLRLGTDRTICHRVLDSDRIHLRRAKEITDLYEELWNKNPPSETRAQKSAITLTKRMAREKGWFPPMAWDDKGIDIPEYKAVA